MQDEVFLNDQFRAVVVGARVDKFSSIRGAVFSPRVALVIKPEREQHVPRVLQPRVPLAVGDQQLPRRRDREADSAGSRINAGVRQSTSICCRSRPSATRICRKRRSTRSRSATRARAQEPRDRDGRRTTTTGSRTRSSSRRPARIDNPLAPPPGFPDIPGSPVSGAARVGRCRDETGIALAVDVHLRELRPREEPGHRARRRHGMCAQVGERRSRTTRTRPTRT